MSNEQMPGWAKEIQQQQAALAREINALKGGRPDQKEEPKEPEKKSDDVSKAINEWSGKPDKEPEKEKSKIEKEIEAWADEVQSFYHPDDQNA